HLGAKNSTIVHQDAKLEPTLINLLYSAFSSAGQNALSTSLVAIHRSIHQDFISQFHKLAKKIVIDHPIEHEHEPFMGPLIDQQAVDNYLLYMGMAKREGIEEIMRGKQLSKRYPGHYVSPAIHLTDCDHTDSHFLSNEIIGPVCTFLVYDEIEQAINLVNSSQYGLVTSLFTSDKNIQQRCIETICSANINLNLPTTFQRFSLPIMGIKQSGNYHPGGSGTIRQSVYPLSCLESNSLYENNLEPIKRGINYDN
ncbi:MAG: aldehyde dehydrogenase family protein, partial [Bdellovibrionales bacterium]|nr:aldehyde dehydrogenase family protein [Bdellovibrionales bacterium]